MPTEKKTGLDFFVVIFCAVSLIGIIFLYFRWTRNRKLRESLSTVLPLIGKANARYARLTDFRDYFSNFQCEHFLADEKPLLNKVPSDYAHIGLEESEIDTIRSFQSAIDSLPAARSSYNDLFVDTEIAKYKYFFDGLENYPLSYEQMEAVVRDEDNNLVIAGAGTGKTTTVSAKVAYLLEKGLASPEELLVISFTKMAVSEMFDRCVKFCGRDFSEGELQVKTFNAFGYLVNRTCSDGGLRLAFDGDDGRVVEFLELTFSELYQADSEFERMATNYLAFFTRPYKNELSFASGDEHIKYERSFSNVSLDGGHFKSGQEVQIANFLYLNSVVYEYEKFFPLELNDRDPRWGDYCPDFYFPQADIWLEHFGIDENGDVPSFFRTRQPYRTARDYYHAGMKWKEEMHTKYGTRFIRSYSYEAKRGRLLANLRENLEKLGVEMVPREKGEIIEAIKKHPEFEGLIRLMHTFMGLMKSNNRTPAQLQAMAVSDKRFRVFLGVFSKIYQRYEEKLARDSAIDYNDMVNRATSLIETGAYDRKYRYILVDEFQDMSVGRYQLLRALLGASPGCKLYAVGDDWQSIFRFTGSDISIMTGFERQFGYSHQSKIARTYRFNDEILEATSFFVQRNPSQIRKSLQSGMPAQGPSFEFIALDLGRSPRELHGMARWEKLDQILQGLCRPGEKLDVFLIGRYHHNRPDDFTELVKRYPSMSISYFTAHSVKGLTCDYAILLDMDSGQFGFPSEVADDPMLNYLLHEGDSFENAEERRLFYVALTRAKHKMFLVYNQASPSKFVLELMEYKKIEPQGGHQRRCPECSGPMVHKTIRHRDFFACSNYPHCRVLLPVPVASANGTA